MCASVRDDDDLHLALGYEFTGVLAGGAMQRAFAFDGEWHLSQLLPSSSQPPTHTFNLLKTKSVIMPIFALSFYLFLFQV